MVIEPNIVLSFGEINLFNYEKHVIIYITIFLTDITILII